MNLDKIFGLSKQAHDVPMGVASTHRYDDQQGTPVELRLVDPTGWEKFKHGLGVSTLSIPAGVALGAGLGEGFGVHSGYNPGDSPHGLAGAVLGGLGGLGYSIRSGLNAPQRLVARASQPLSNIPDQEPTHVEMSSKLSSALGFAPEGVSLRSAFGFDKAAAPVMAPGLLKRLSATLKGGKVAK